MGKNHLGDSITEYMASNKSFNFSGLDFSTFKMKNQNADYATITFVSPFTT